MKNKLYLRLFFSVASVFLAGLLLFAGTMVFALASQQETERFDQLRNEALSIAESLQQVDKGQNYSDEIKRMASAFSNLNDSTVFFVNRSGLVSVCSDSINHVDCPHTDLTLDAATLRAVFTKGRYESTDDFGGIYDCAYHTVGVPILGQSASFDMAVFVSAKVDYHLDTFAEILGVCLVPFLASLAVIFLVVFLISRNTMRPIREISEATKAMANGDFRCRVSETRRDEIGELARHFNKMAESLGALENMSNSFVTNVSHDLKTPMTTIAGFVDGILDGTIPQSEHRRYLSIVSDEVKRLSNTVNTMLNLAKIQSGMTDISYTQVDLADLVFRVVLSFEHALTEKGIDVLGLDSMNPAFLDGDENLLFQALYNLVDNAVKFTQPGGYISFSISENNSDLELYIKNSGDGIPEKDLQHVFERFYKTDKSRSEDKSGAGVGLYIVKTIVENHGGTVTVKSAEGQYTQFCIRLSKTHK